MNIYNLTSLRNPFESSLRIDILNPFKIPHCVFIYVKRYCQRAVVIVMNQKLKKSRTITNRESSENQKGI